MTGPPRRQSNPISALRIAVLVLLLVAGTIAVLSFVVSKRQAPPQTQESGTDTNLTANCENACRNCVSEDYDARCFDRCRFGFRPYCD
jgi:hypothetical protein